MEPFVRIGNLNQDCVVVFNELIEEQKINKIRMEILTKKIQG